MLDPVAAGVGVARTEILEGFKDYPPTVIRANASEALVLHDMWQLGDAAGTDEHNGPAGVEAADSVDAAITAATGLAAYLALHSPPTPVPSRSPAKSISSPTDDSSTAFPVEAR